MRITPACAGNRSLQFERYATVRDHPRVCGEQAYIFGRLLLVWGSPPRVRGTDLPIGFCSLRQRITPACAGNSTWYDTSIHTLWDHPRVCGEQATLSHKLAASQGSPPRVRGTAHGTNPGRPGERITPACAGNSQKLNSPCNLDKDHPRVCGEQLACFCFCLTYKGSPPRVRGTGTGKRSSCRNKGITPACAGNRVLKTPVMALSKDHPRVCGEQPG